MTEPRSIRAPQEQALPVDRKRMNHMGADVREPGAVLLRQTAIVGLVSAALAVLSRALDGSFSSANDPTAFAVFVLPLIIAETILAVVPITAVMRSWRWARRLSTLHPVWPMLGLVAGTAMFAAAYLPGLSEVADGPYGWGDIRSPLRTLVVPGFLLAVFSAVNVTPRRWRLLDYGSERRRRGIEEPTTPIAAEAGQLLLAQLGVFLAAVAPYIFFFEFIGDGQVGATDWLGFLLIVVTVLVLTSGAASFIVGLPLRLVPVLRRWWYRQAVLFPALMGVGYVLLIFSSLPGISYGHMGEEPYVWLWSSSGELPTAGLALVAFGSLHSVLPGWTSPPKRV